MHGLNVNFGVEFRDMKKKISKKSNRSKLEMKLDEVNHTMELIRTVIPIVILVIQIVILIKLFSNEKAFRDLGSGFVVISIIGASLNVF